MAGSTPFWNAIIIVFLDLLLLFMLLSYGISRHIVVVQLFVDCSNSCSRPSSAVAVTTGSAHIIIIIYIIVIVKTITVRCGDD